MKKKIIILAVLSATIFSCIQVSHAATFGFNTDTSGGTSNDSVLVTVSTNQSSGNSFVGIITPSSTPYQVSTPSMIVSNNSAPTCYTDSYPSGAYDDFGMSYVGFDYLTSSTVVAYYEITGSGLWNGHTWAWYLTNHCYFLRNPGIGWYHSTAFQTLNPWFGGGPDTDYLGAYAAGDSTSSILAAFSMTPTESINFIYPQNGTTTPRFNNFAFSFSNLIATHTYQIQTQNYLPQVTPQNLYTASGRSAQELLANGLLIPWQNSSFINITTTSTWLAAAQLYDSTNCDITQSETVCQTPVASTTITYDLLPTCSALVCIGTATNTQYFVNTVNTSGTITATTMTTQVAILPGSLQLTSLASSSVLLSGTCEPAADWTDIGGGLRYAFCSAINFVFIPSSLVTDNITAQITIIEGDFPFNLVYGTLNNIKSAAQTGSQGGSTSLTLPIWGMDIPILSSTTLSGFVGDNNKTLIFNTEDAIAWVGVGFTILKIIF